MPLEKQKLQKKDFIEIEFTGKVKDGEVFDSNVKEELQKLHAGHDHGPHNHPMPEAKPFIFSLGEGMFLPGIDEFLIGKEINQGDSFNIELPPEKAFGPRNPKIIQLMPASVFKKQNITPIPGTMFNFDGRVAKILSVSGGRIRVDFNNPLSGKNVVYDLKILRKVTDLNEKIKFFIEFLFRHPLDFKLDEKNKKVILEMDPQMLEFGNLFKEKFKEVFDLDLEVKEKKENVSKEEGKEKVEKSEKRDNEK